VRRKGGDEDDIGNIRKKGKVTYQGRRNEHHNRIGAKSKVGLGREGMIGTRGVQLEKRTNKKKQVQGGKEAARLVWGGQPNEKTKEKIWSTKGQQ